MELYRAASELGFALAILGNPAARSKIKRIVAVEPPAFYQVSLEGLKSHNDEIRGSGHYDRVMAFLDVLREFGIYSMVMLTLTRDNLMNILLRKEGEDLFGGCAGYGCGAAFNFISLLPDGKAHACRKFPSPIGNVLEEGIAAAYDSEAAEPRVLLNALFSLIQPGKAGIMTAATESNYREEPFHALQTASHSPGVPQSSGDDRFFYGQFRRPIDRNEKVWRR